MQYKGSLSPGTSLDSLCYAESKSEGLGNRDGLFEEILQDMAWVIPSPSFARMPRVNLSEEGRSSLSFSRSKPPLRSEGTVNG